MTDPSAALADHAALLAALESRGRLRQLQAAAGKDFASNDYLGLAGSAELKNAALAAIAADIPAGACAARLLRGNAEPIVALEHKAAALFGHPAALYFASGYLANLAIFSALPLQRDLVLHDALIHASAIDGMRLGKAKILSFTHNDASDAAARIATWRAQGGEGRIWIAVESLYSMDGDFAPLSDLAELAIAEDAWLIVDEAHATGVWPPSHGLGLSHDLSFPRQRLVTLHTCGKALGVAGALVTLDPVLRETLINRARGFIYSTAPSPLTAAITAAALDSAISNSERRAALHARIAHAYRGAAAIGLDPGQSQIITVPVAGDHAALALSGALQRAGYDVRAIRSPTVPKGSERLRITTTNKVSLTDIDGLFATLGDLGGQVA